MEVALTFSKTQVIGTWHRFESALRHISFFRWTFNGNTCGYVLKRTRIKNYIENLVSRQKCCRIVSADASFSGVNL